MYPMTPYVHDVLIDDVIIGFLIADLGVGVLICFFKMNMKERTKHFLVPMQQPFLSISKDLVIMVNLKG